VPYRTAEYDARSITRLLDRVEINLRSKFLVFVDDVRNQLTPDSIERMILERRYQEASEAFSDAARVYAREIEDEYRVSGKDAATFLRTALDMLVSFDQFNARAVNHARRNELRLVRGLTEEQRTLIRQVVANGIARGTNPRAQAREFRDSIGLTPRQQASVENYRRVLENQGRQPLKEALNRERRDARSDRSVTRAIADQVALTPAHIDSMVERYAQRLLILRSETIARTEALRSVHEGANEMFQQVLQAGDIATNEVDRKWNNAGDSRVRDLHLEPLDGQVVGPDEPFIDANGNMLMYPGDQSARPETTINCRCVISWALRVWVPELLSSGATAEADVEADVTA